MVDKTMPCEMCEKGAALIAALRIINNLRNHAPVIFVSHYGSNTGTVLPSSVQYTIMRSAEDAMIDEIKKLGIEPPVLL